MASITRRRTSDCTLKLTSMIDVTFLLLIFFVVTANFIREGLVLSQLPGGPDDDLVLPIRVQVDQQAGEPVIMVNDVRARPTIDDANCVRIHVDGAVRGQPLTAYLQDLAGRSGFSQSETPVTIDAAPRAQWQYALAAYNSVVAAGYVKIEWLDK